MKNPHEIFIQDALSEVHEVGFYRIEWRKIYRWYGRSRITNSIWDDLENRFKEIDESHGDEGYRLGYLDWEQDGFLTLVCLDPAHLPPGEESYKPISAIKK